MNEQMVGGAAGVVGWLGGGVADLSQIAEVLSMMMGVGWCWGEKFLAVASATSATANTSATSNLTTTKVQQLTANMAVTVIFQGCKATQR